MRGAWWKIVVGLAAASVVSVACDGLLGVDFGDARAPATDAGAEDGSPDGPSAACAATCRGCCVGDLCKAGDVDEACGTSGGACTACGAKTCKAGACVPAVVLFGGTSDDASVLPAETWTWDGDSWKQRLTAGPPARSGGAMAALGSDVFVGYGYDPLQAGPLNDWWKWDGHRWSSVFASSRDATVPSGRENPTVGALNGKIVLFGGTLATRASTGSPPVYDPLGDMWEFDGSSWKKRAVPSPSKRFAGAVARLGNKLVLHGGIGCSDICYRAGDTWEWDGTSWTDRGTGGPNSGESVMAALGGKLVLFGGGTGDETWQWDGNSWTQWSVPGPKPSPRTEAAMVPYGDKVVLFGGRSSQSATRYGDTWEWDGTVWRERKGQGPSPRSGHTMAVPIE